ncbi:aminotransferase class I/II-fold pyridoxal phosphate-dependent enzyme [Spirillospora sp. NPDC048911]|uniref:aminotransferase class I/II-fold pyridoxal phosphate-dependent enzyme n=1 Tax=Spirillospora sp. NPDC048911 TaxID=3364527 RepID=UPI003716F590
MTLAIDGGTPVHTSGWPAWPPPATAEQRALLLDVLESGRWGATSGTKVAEFAAAFAESVGARYAVCVVNGTVGLFLALRALGAGPGDEVIVPAYTFVASATSVVLAGARPVLTYERLWSLHNVGRRLDGGWYEHPEIGWNLRMTEFQAAVLLPQLAVLDEQIAVRERAAAYLAEELAAVGGLSLVPGPEGTTRHSRHLGVVRYDPAAFGGRSKAGFIAAMAAEGIPLDAGYRSLSREAALRPYTGEVSCPVAEAAEDSVVWLRQNLLMAGDAALADIVSAAAKVRRAFRSQPEIT